MLVGSSFISRGWQLDLFCVRFKSTCGSVAGERLCMRKTHMGSDVFVVVILVVQQLVCLTEPWQVQLASNLRGVL